MKHAIAIPLVAIYVTACSSITPAPIPTLFVTATPSHTPTPTATLESPTLTATPVKEIVSEGSFWAEANVPMGLEVRLAGNIYYAINRVGQEIEVGKLDSSGGIEPAEWLQYQRIPEQVTPEIPFDPQIALMNGILNAEPFAENIEACKPGDVAASSKAELGGKQKSYSYLFWSDGLKNKIDRPAKIIWKFNTTYSNGMEMKGKVIEWLTPDRITYTVYVSSSRFYTDVAGDEGELFPFGLVTTPQSENDLQPNGMLLRDPISNKLLEEWIATGCPSPELQTRFLYGYHGIKQK